MALQFSNWDDDEVPEMKDVMSDDESDSGTDVVPTHSVKRTFPHPLTTKKPLPSQRIISPSSSDDMVSILSVDIGIKNLGYTIVSFHPNPSDASEVNISFGIANISERGGSDVISSRCKSLYTFLERITSNHHLVKIIIEKQVPTNVKAMELMYALYGMSMNVVSPDNVIIYDPKLKFTTLNVKYDTKNKRHKRQSINYARSIIEKLFDNKLDEFESHPKKDDISDSLNQCLIYMTANRMFERMSISDLKGLYDI